MYAILSKK